MPRYLDPKNDLTFKKVFGGHTDLCISLLNAMLPLGKGRSVVKLQYRTGGEPSPRSDGGRNPLVDVLCEDNTGQPFTVDIQMYSAGGLKQRTLFDAFTSYIARAEVRTKGKLHPVYALSFVNDVFDPETAEYYHHFAMANVADTERRIEGLALVFIELPKFKPGARAARDLRDLWLLYLTGIGRGDETVPAALLEQPETREAVRCLEEQTDARAADVSDNPVAAATGPAAKEIVER
jgi:predicted transposase/invertase (TIGR01784 family)